MFISALSIIAKTKKQLKYPVEGEWINKLWYNQAVDCYSMLRSNEVSSQENI